MIIKYVIVISVALLSNAQLLSTIQNQNNQSNQTKSIIHQIPNINLTNAAVVDATSNTTDSILFMNEQQRSEGDELMQNSTTNKNEFMNENTQVASNKSDIASVKKLVNDLLDTKTEGLNDQLTEKFDFNLDDLEDLHSIRTESDSTEDRLPKALDMVAENTGDFEEFRLETVTQGTVAQSQVPLKDAVNVYKVIKSSRSPIVVQTIKTPLNGTSEASKINNFHSFQVFKEMYKQNKWNIDDITKVVNVKCARDMRQFLMDLSNDVQWAIEGINYICLRYNSIGLIWMHSFLASDQSGNYRGHYFYGNEFWVGSKLFCEEINNRRSLNETLLETTPELEFFVATLLVSIPERMVSTYTYI